MLTFDPFIEVKASQSGTGDHMGLEVQHINGDSMKETGARLREGGGTATEIGSEKHCH